MKSDFRELTNYDSMSKYFKSRRRYIVFYGGAGAGKSYACADRIIYEVLRQDIKKKRPLKFIVVRKTLPSLKKSCMPIIENRFNTFHIPYRLNKTDFIAKIGGRSQILYLSMNNEIDYEKVKSITDVDYIWIEEASELPKKAYEILKTRLRGGKAPYPQMWLTFNPISTSTWIYDYFFVNNHDNPGKFKVTIQDNKFKDIQYEQELMKFKDINIEMYNVYYLGLWGQVSETIFTNYDIVSEPPGSYDDFYYGLDFGFSINPSALVRIYQKGIEYWIEEMFIQKGLTNLDLINEFRDMKIDMKKEIYADSAEPKSIEQIYRAGFNIKPAKKGQDSVKAGIDFVKSVKLHILSNSNKLLNEIKGYCWKKDRNDEIILQPIKMNDHCMDAMRMAIFTHQISFKNIPNIKFGGRVFG